MLRAASRASGRAAPRRLSSRARDGHRAYLQGGRRPAGAEPSGRSGPARSVPGRVRPRRPSRRSPVGSLVLPCRVEIPAPAAPASGVATPASARAPRASDRDARTPGTSGSRCVARSASPRARRSSSSRSCERIASRRRDRRRRRGRRRRRRRQDRAGGARTRSTTSPAPARADPVHVRIGPTELVRRPGDASGYTSTRRDTVRARRGRPGAATTRSTRARRARCCAASAPTTSRSSCTVDHGRLDAVIDTWVGATGKGLVDGGLRFDGAQVVEIAAAAGHRASTRRRRARRSCSPRWRAGRAGPSRTLAIGPTRPDRRRGRRSRPPPRGRARCSRRPHADRRRARPRSRSPRRSSRRRHGAHTTDVALVVARRRPTACTPRSRRSLVGVETTARRTRPVAINGTTASVVPAVTGAALDTAPDRPTRSRAAATHVVGTLADHAAARTHRVGAEAQHHRARLELHDHAPVLRSPGSPTSTAPPTRSTARSCAPGQTFRSTARSARAPSRRATCSRPAIGADLECRGLVGGGVSQLSTTLFNAMFFGCYEDVTHTVHALYISRYPMGREATLNYPSIDNKFRNDSDSGVLIRATYSDTSVTVSFYGNKEGRTVRAEGPNMLETIEPPTEYVDDPTLPAGTEKVTKAGSPGYVVENFRIITRAGQPDVRQRFVERYQAVPTKREPQPDARAGPATGCRRSCDRPRRGPAPPAELRSARQRPQGPPTRADRSRHEETPGPRSSRAPSTVGVAAACSPNGAPGRPARRCRRSSARSAPTSSPGSTRSAPHADSHPSRSDPGLEARSFDWSRTMPGLATPDRAAAPQRPQPAARALHRGGREHRVDRAAAAPGSSTSVGCSSDGHRQNMLAPNVDVVGIAVSCVGHQMWVTETVRPAPRRAAATPTSAACRRSLPSPTPGPAARPASRGRAERAVAGTRARLTVESDRDHRAPLRTSTPSIPSRSTSTRSAHSATTRRPCSGSTSASPTDEELTTLVDDLQLHPLLADDLAAREPAHEARPLRRPLPRRGARLPR